MESPKSYTLRVRKQELIKIKEELKKAKENATQSWIDSRPLIDELERLKSNLEILKNKTSVSSTILFSELENELETTNAEIKSRKKEELKVTKQADEITRALDQVREEMETLKPFVGSKKQKKLKMKRVLRLRRQRLRSLQLRIEAVRKEIEAYVESREEALRYLAALETLVANEGVDYDHNHDHDEVQVLSHEEYMALKKRVDEENSLADWRVSVAEEQKNEAKKSRDLAMAKLRELKLAKTARRRKEVGEREEDFNVVGEEDDIERVVEDDENKEGDKRDQIVAVIPMNQSRKKDKDYQELEEKRPEKSAKKKKRKKKMTKKKKKSIFWQMKQCFVFSLIRRLFR